MATSEENDLIGYDPLAWMESDTDKNEGHLVTDQIDSGNKPEDTADDSDDLIGNAEENELVMDEIEIETDSICIEEDVAEDMEAEDKSVTVDSLSDAGAAAEDSVSEEMDESQIDLDTTLTIQNVVKLHEKLKNVLAVHDQIEINASDVSSIDTATLQLLVSLKKDAVKLQKQVTIIYPSPRFVESAQLLGLLEVLGINDV